MDAELIVRDMLRVNDIVAELNDRVDGGNYFWSYATNTNLRNIVGAPVYFCIWYIEHGPAIVSEAARSTPSPEFIFNGPIDILERMAKKWNPKGVVRG